MRAAPHLPAALLFALIVTALAAAGIVMPSSEPETEADQGVWCLVHGQKLSSLATVGRKQAPAAAVCRHILPQAVLGSRRWGFCRTGCRPWRKDGTSLILRVRNPFVPLIGRGTEGAATIHMPRAVNSRADQPATDATNTRKSGGVALCVREPAGPDWLGAFRNPSEYSSSTRVLGLHASSAVGVQGYVTSNSVVPAQGAVGSPYYGANGLHRRQTLPSGTLLCHSSNLRARVYLISVPEVWLQSPNPFSVHT